jgi:hypothetical protein
MKSAGGRRRGGHTALSGFTLPEALVTVLLLALLIQGVWSVFAHHRNAALSTTHRAEGLETIRTVSWILSRELSGSREGRDRRGMSPDSFSVRAFRGMGTVVPSGSPKGTLRVCYQGLRAPDPGKDSVLLLTAAGSWRAGNLETRRVVAATCPSLPGGRLEEWTLEGGSGKSQEGVVARIFESGSYHLADEAFRYRRGRGGRQPLTAPRIHAGSFRAGAGGELRWRLHLTVPGRGADTLAWEGVAG